jgi:hypothetical protein
MVLGEFIRTIYHEVEIHENAAFEKAIMRTVGRPREELLDYFPLVMKCFCGVRSGIKFQEQVSSGNRFLRTLARTQWFDLL